MWRKNVEFYDECELLSQLVEARPLVDKETTLDVIVRD